MPTDQDIRAYAKSLPRIYREILAAFPMIEPNRKMGYGLAFQTIAADFEARQLGFTLGQVIKACEQLREKGLVDVKYRIFVHPTEFGEHLIEVITGMQPADNEIPALPTPPA